MNPEIDELLQKYFDGEPSAVELQSLQRQLCGDRNSLELFVETAFLHDRLHGVFQAQAALRQLPSNSVPTKIESTDEPIPNHGFSTARRRLVTLAAIAALVLFMLAIWRGGNDQAHAGVSEWKRVIAANAMVSVRAYSMDVEAMESAPSKRRRSESDERRPIKPPLDRATLYVRGNQDFVLMRKTRDDRDFITGCDGHTSWAISPDGPVRVSDDLSRFHRDVPGHEFSMPLCHLNDALERLQSVCDIALLPVEYSDGEHEDTQVRRLLVATKKRGHRGPRRVEITYLADSGVIESLRFVDMPYGPERVTVRLSSMPAPPVPDDFFTHRPHHAPDREIQIE